MALYDDAVLAMIPSGKKAGTLYSQIPNTAVGDFDVSRADKSMRVNKDGYLEEVQENVPVLSYDTIGGCPHLETHPASTNLLTYPISLGNSYWTKSGASIEGDPSTAGSELIIDGEFNTACGVNWTCSSGVTIGSGVCSFSSVATGAGVFQSPLAVGDFYMITYTISNYSSGSLKFWTTSIPSSNGTHTVYIEALSVNASFLSNSGSTTLDIDDVSIKQVQPYESPLLETVYNTGSELVTNGGFDTDSDWTKGAAWTISGGTANANSSSTSNMYQTTVSIVSGSFYLVEFDVSNYVTGRIQPQFNTQIITSETQSNGSYSYYVEATVTTSTLNLYAIGTTQLSIDNVSIKEVTSITTGSPRLEAWKLVEDNSTGTHYLSSSTMAVSSGETFSYAIYAKAGERSKFGFGHLTVSGFENVYDLTNGTVASGGDVDDAGIESLANGWYKCYGTTTSVVTDARALGITLFDNNGDKSYTGDGTSGIYIAYPQLEEQSYATPLMIDLDNEGSTVSRVADLITNGGDASLFNSINNAGVLYWEVSSNDDAANLLGISDGTTSNHAYIYLAADKLSIRAAVNAGAEIIKTTDATTYHKCALKWDGADYSFYVDGSLVGSNTATTISGLDNIRFANPSSSAINVVFANTKSVQVYPLLTDTQLEALTSP